MITDRDRRIIRYMEQYKYATIEHIQKIFFTKQKDSYRIARRRLNEIVRAGYLKVDRDIDTTRLIYMLNEPKIKMPDRHRVILLDVLANLHASDYNVQIFDVEKEWMGGKIRSDGFTVFTCEMVKKNRYQFFIEVDLSNNPLNLAKYNDVLETNEIEEYLGRKVVPRILLITDRKPSESEIKSVNTKVIVMDTKLTEFASIILPD